MPVSATANSASARLRAGSMMAQPAAATAVSACACDQVAQMRCAARARATRSAMGGGGGARGTSWAMGEGALEGAVECSMGSRQSIGMEVGLPGQLLPAHEFGADDLAELLRRAANAFAALGQQLVAQVRLPEHRVDGAVELVDGRLRRFGGHEH